MLSPSKHSSALFGALLFFASYLVADVANTAERAQGVLEIRIKDHRDAIGDFAKLNINIDKILISPNVRAEGLANRLARTHRFTRHGRFDEVHWQDHSQSISLEHRSQDRSMLFI